MVTAIQTRFATETACCIRSGLSGLRVVPPMMTAAMFACFFGPRVRPSLPQESLICEEANDVRTFIHVDFSKAAAINFNVKLGPTHGNNGAGCADLECRRSAHTLLNLRAHAAHQKLKIFPSAGLRLLQQSLV